MRRGRGCELGLHLGQPKRKTWMEGGVGGVKEGRGIGQRRLKRKIQRTGREMKTGVKTKGGCTWQNGRGKEASLVR